MKVHLSLAFLFGGLLSGALAQGTSPASSSSTAADLTSLPPCALVCLSKAIVESPCAATNQTCLCLNAQLQDSVTNCVLASCTVKQALFTKNVTSTNCHAPIRDKTTEYNIISNTLGTISAVVVLLRLGFRQFVAKAEIGMDDWLILAALIFGIPSTVLNERGLTAHGLGRDVWTLPFEMVTDFGRYLYIMEVLYFLHINMFKLSMLFFYLRIFPAPGVRRTIWGTIAFTTVFCLTFIFLAIFQCSPISFFWDKWDGEHQGKCLNINAIPWANAAIGISLDLWMLAIPLWQLRDLNLHWKKKIGVAMMFCVGTFVTVVSILRLSSLVHFANSVNPTWDNWDISNWSTIEVNVGIICACMPSLRLILVRLFPKLMGSTRHYYANYGSGHASQNQKSQRSQRSRVKNMGNVAVSTTSSSNERTGPKGIVCQKTFAVDYGDRDNDEAQLVHMRDLNLKSGSRSESSL